MASDEFPDDENGDALRNMKESGDDLSKSRTINFSVLFQSVSGAKRFIEAAHQLHIDAILEEDSPDSESADVTVKRDMIPSHKDIGDFEKTLERIATPLGGTNDGWGCFAV